MLRKKSPVPTYGTALLVLAALAALALLPRCESIESPAAARTPIGGSDWFQADPAFPDSTDSTYVPSDPIPGFDDPTQPHP
jgi:hypothetical protein